MKAKNTSNKKAVAFVFALFIALLVSSLSAVNIYEYVSSTQFQRNHLNSLQGFYTAEAAKKICLWEAKQHDWLWETTNANPLYAPQLKYPQGTDGPSIDTNGFYIWDDGTMRFKAKAEINEGTLYIYARGLSTNESVSRFLECRRAPNPMYQYAFFSNRDLLFSGKGLYDFKGGKVHTNRNLKFAPSGSHGLIFNQIGEMSAAGTIKYEMRYQMPAPHYFDDFDGNIQIEELGMAPAPYWGWRAHHKTFTNDNVIPGPFGAWSYSAATGWSRGYKTYGDWLAGNWGSSDTKPWAFWGEDTFFYGTQHTGSNYYYSETYGTLTSEPSTYYGLTTLNGASDFFPASNSNIKIVRFSLNPNTNSLSASVPQWQSNSFVLGNLVFRPFKDKLGNLNDLWFQLPGGLSDAYSWKRTTVARSDGQAVEVLADKYTGKTANESPVILYATEKCDEGSSGCKVSKGPDSSIATGWRYRKKDAEGNFCLTDECYNNLSSQYVKAKDTSVGTQWDSAIFDACFSGCSTGPACDQCWQNAESCSVNCSCTDECRFCLDDWGDISMCPGCETCQECRDACYSAFDCSSTQACVEYFSCWGNCYNQAQIPYPYFNRFLNAGDSDKNEAMFGDAEYRYGVDINNEDSQARKIHALNALLQPQGFSEYLALLSNPPVQGATGVEGIFQAGVQKIEPQFTRIFDDPDNPVGESSRYKEMAQTGGVYISADQDIDAVVSSLNSGLEDEQKFASKKQFFNWKTNRQVTLVDINIAKFKTAKGDDFNGFFYAEHPIRLSNAQSLPGTNSAGKTAVFTLISEESVYLKGDYNTQDWKISHIATPRKVFTLSNAFADPQSVPSFKVYLNYPYVKVGVSKDANGLITGYTGVVAEDTPDAQSVWVSADDVLSKNPDGSYKYYYAMSQELRNAVVTQKNTLQANHIQANAANFPNTIDKNSYSYNSLFITPYATEVLEDWQVCSGASCSAATTRTLKGTMFDFYDPDDPDYDDEYMQPLRPEENSSSYFDYRGRKAPLGYLSWQSMNPSTLLSVYDDRFPQASPTTTESVLSFTGNDLWRQIGQDHYCAQTADPDICQ